MGDRIRCFVIGCRRTCADDGRWKEFLCARHYPMVDKRTRRLRARVKRKAGRIGWTPSLQALEHRLWNRAKSQATERAMGITA